MKVAPPHQALLGWMASLSDPTRLRLLRLVERHELGVAELCGVLQLPQSTVSRHLKVLGDEGWVRSRSRGTTRLYGMASVETAPRKLWLLAREETKAWPTVQQDRLRLARRLAERQPTAQAFFAGAVGKWDRLRGELYGQGFSVAALLSLLPPAWTVADLGCGTGPTLAALAPYVERVIGVDQSAAMLRAARKRALGLGNVELRQGSLEALPLDDASVDGALMVLALTYVAEPARAIVEMGRVLKPGGRAVVVDLLRHDREEFRRQMGQQSPGFDPEDLQAMLGEAGLREVSCRPLPPEPKAKGPALVLAVAAREGCVAEKGERPGDARKEEVAR